MKRCPGGSGIRRCVGSQERAAHTWFSRFEQKLLTCRPLVSDRVSFELSQEAVEALRAKLVSTPGFGKFGQHQQQPQQQAQQQHRRPPPAPPRGDSNDAEFRRWKV